MTNPRQHGMKVARNAFISNGIDVRVMCAPGMLWIGGLVRGATGRTIREFRYPAFHKMVNVI